MGSPELAAQRQEEPAAESDRSIQRLILAVILTYVTLHVAEEGLFGFPAWAEKYWRIPDFTPFKWLVHQPYFLASLGVTYMVYRRDPDRFLPVGLGIIVWGVLNVLDHVGSLLVFRVFSPGLVTALVFAAVAAAAFNLLRVRRKLSPRVVGIALAVGVLNFAVPITAFIYIDKLLGF